MPKPTRKKKPFLRKKESTSYRLITGYVEDEDDVSKPSEEELERRKQEQRDHGIFYGDDYNYMKHLRNVNEAATMVETEIKDDETMSQATTMRRPWEMFSTDETEEEKIDPEILAALEDAPVVPLNEDSDEVPVDDNFLEDDFFSKAGGVVPMEELKEEDEFEFSDNSQDLSDDEDDRFSLQSFSDDSDRLGAMSDDDEDSSPAVRRGRGTKEDDIVEAQTAAILKNFEKGLGFGFSAVESVDDQEMPSAEDYEHIKHIMNQGVIKDKPVSWFEVLDDKSERAKVDTSKYIYEDEDEYVWKDVPPAKPKYDCVSILSLRSSTRNLPTDLLPPPKERSKAPSHQGSGDNESTLHQGLSLKQLEQEMRESRRADKASTFRPEDETAEEKKARKKAVKDERRERRQEKKANKMVFAIENERMKQDTAQLSKSVKSVKLS